MSNKKIDKRYHEPTAAGVERWYRVADAASAYHRHEIHGLDNLPSEGRCLVVVNHSLATYDNALLGNAIRSHTKRLMRPLSDRSLFYIPAVGRAMGQAGFVPARPHVAEYLLEREELLMVAPGGMREALKPSTEKNKIYWDTRKGFVRLAIQMQTPVILSACPAADNMYTVYENALTKLVYKRARMPMAMVRGWGPTMVPRPVKIKHYLSELMHPPQVDVDNQEAFDQAVDQWHAELIEKMESMLEQHA